MDEIVREFFSYVKARWHRKSTLVIIVLFSSLVLLWMFSGINLREITKAQLWIGGGFLLILVGFWIYSTRIPKVAKGKIGFAIGIKTDNPNQQLKIKRDFIDALRELLYKSKYKYSFQFIELPDHVLEKIDSPDAATKMLHELEYSFMVYGKARTVELKGQTQHVLNLEGVVAHNPIPKEISNSFSREFADLFPRRLMISSEGDLFNFEFTASWVDVVSKYIIGVASLLSGDVGYAQGLFESLQMNLKEGKTELPVTIKIRERLPLRLREIYLIRARMHYEDWKRTKDVTDMAKMEPFLDSLDAISPTYTEGRILRSMWYFVVSRNITKAKAEVVKSKTKKNVLWRYNLAFLLAYEGKLENASKEYRLASRGFIPHPSLIFEIVEFILWVLDVEPDKSQLYFCLGMIYYYVVEDYALALQDFEQFLEITSPKKFVDQRLEAENIIAKIEKKLKENI